MIGSTCEDCAASEKRSLLKRESISTVAGRQVGERIVAKNESNVAALRRGLAGASNPPSALQSSRFAHAGRTARAHWAATMQNPRRLLPRRSYRLRESLLGARSFHLNRSGLFGTFPGAIQDLLAPGSPCHQPWASLRVSRILPGSPRRRPRTPLGRETHPALHSARGQRFRLPETKCEPRNMAWWERRPGSRICPPEAPSTHKRQEPPFAFLRVERVPPNQRPVSEAPAC